MKKAIVGVALVASLGLGEFLEPVSYIRDSVKFYQVPLGDDFPRDPWNYSVKRDVYEVDGTKYQGLYLVNEKTGLHKRIDEEGCTCGLDNTVDDMWRDTKEWLQEKAEATQDWIEETYKEWKKD